MSASRLTPQVRAFLGAHLDSFEKLELVHQLATIDASISVTALSDQIGLDGEVADAALKALARGGWVESGAIKESVQLSSRARHDAHFQASLVAYREDRTAVLSAVSAIAMAKIRSMAARAFSDAFVLRKKGGDSDG